MPAVSLSTRTCWRHFLTTPAALSPSQVGAAPTRHELTDDSAHQVSFQDVIRAIKALVDKQAGGPAAPAARYLRGAGR